jgi:hypothetical protein
LVLSVVREGAEVEGYRVEGIAPASRTAPSLTNSLSGHDHLGA